MQPERAHIVRAVDIADDTDEDVPVELHQYPGDLGPTYAVFRDGVRVHASTNLADAETEFTTLTGNPPAMPDPWYAQYRDHTDQLDGRDFADRWYALGLHPLTAALWARLGFTPGEAEPWVKEHIAPDVAARLAADHVGPKEARIAGHHLPPTVRW